MNRLFSLSVMIFTAFALAAIPFEDAEAKRFGFGKSFGKQYNYSAPARPAAPASSSSSRQSAAAAGQPGAGTSGAGRWLGPLAGIAAGGLLASLFFGDAFEGLQLLDFLLIGGLLFGGLALFRAMRSRGAPQFRTATASAAADFRGADADFGAEKTRGYRGGDAALDSVDAFDRPPWFDEAGFVAGAKTHFIRLQAAWDKGDLQDIAEYTTPELYAEIQAERLNRGEERHFTEVVTLNTDLLGLRREGDQVTASIRFSGLIREERDGRAEEFAEVWHVMHRWDSPEGDWQIAGIQQL